MRDISARELIGHNILAVERTLFPPCFHQNLYVI